MAKISAESRFSEKRSLTMPVVRVPKKVKDVLGIDKAYENGIFKIEPMDGTAMYDRCYVFEDVNYINKDEEEKTSTLLEFMKLLKSMRGQFKITLANEQRDMEEFIEEIFNPLHEKEYPLITSGIGRWINQKIDEGTRDISQKLLLTVTCRAKSAEEAGAYFATLDTSLQYIFSALRSRLYVMSGIERLAIIQRMMRAGGQGIPVTKISPDDDSWKNQILPACIESEDDYLKINGRYVSVLVAQDYEQSLDEEKVIHGLTDTLFPTYITLDFEPIRKRDLKSKLVNAHANNEKSIADERTRNNKFQQYGAGTSYRLDKKKTELETLLDQVDDNDENAVFLGLLVLVMADSLEELTERVDTLMQIAITNEFTLETYYHRQLKALNTVLPIGGRQVNHMRSLLTSSAVAFQPFYANDLHDPNGFIYGKNETTKRLLIGNRKKLPNPHGMMVGHSGFGKSFLIKETEVAQSLIFTDDDVVILDPNNEQKEFINSVPGGQYFDFTPQSQIYLNPFEIPEYVLKGDSVVKNQFIAKKVEFAVAFCTSVMTNILVTKIHMNYIARTVRKMYEDYFEQKSWKRKEPTLIQVRDILKEQIDKAEYQEEKRMLLDIVDSLEEYTDGVYDMFAHPSNLNIESRLAGFGLKNIPKSVWEPAMITIMHFLTMRIEYNQEKKIAVRLVVDEAQVLCEKETTAEQLLYAVETYRKVGAIVTLAVQNLTRAIENDKLRDMFSNCPYKCFLDQGGIDASNLAKIQDFSEREFAALSGNDVGHGVMVWDGKVYLFDAKMDKQNELFPLFDTDFHNKAAEKNKRV